MNTATLQPVDVAGILDRAGADAGAAPGTQAWALAQVGQLFVALVDAIDNEHQADDAAVACACDPLAYADADEVHVAARARVDSILAVACVRPA